jgi:mersacidin/lichenicidin family type 2 lantibiotic
MKEMSVNIVRAWIDPEYRGSLTAEQLASVPANPVAPGELSEDELRKVSAGMVCYSPTTCRIQDSSKKAE